MNQLEKLIVRQLVELVGDQDELITFLLNELPPGTSAAQIDNAKAEIALKLEKCRRDMALLARASSARRGIPPDAAEEQRAALRQALRQAQDATQDTAQEGRDASRRARWG